MMARPLTSREYDRFTLSQRDSHRPAYSDASIDWLVRATQLKPRDEVLELGAGTGRTTRQLLKHGVQVVAVESDEAAVEIAQRHTPPKASNIAYVTDLSSYVERTIGHRPLHKVVASFGETALDLALHSQFVAAGGKLVVGRSGMVRSNATDPLLTAVTPIFDKYLEGAADDGVYDDHSVAHAKTALTPADQATYGVQLVDSYTETYDRTLSAGGYIGLIGATRASLSLPEAEQRALLTELGGVVRDEFHDRAVVHFAAAMSVYGQT